MRRLLILMLLAIAMLGTAAPASGADGGRSAWAKTCQEHSAGLGFRTVGQCVRTGGPAAPPVEPSLRLADGEWACAYPRGCWLAVYGEGLQPGSLVRVEEVMGWVTYIADAGGRVSVEGIFAIGLCTLRTDPIDFVARGVTAAGDPIASAVLPVDLTDHMAPCP